MKTKILTNELLKARNNLAKKYLKIQAMSIYELGSAEKIIKRCDDLFDIQEAIKQFDILIGYAKEGSYCWDMICLLSEHEDTEKWKPKFAKLSDWKDLTKV